VTSIPDYRSNKLAVAVIASCLLMTIPEAHSGGSGSPVCGKTEQSEFLSYLEIIKMIGSSVKRSGSVTGGMSTIKQGVEVYDEFVEGGAKAIAIPEGQISQTIDYYAEIAVYGDQGTDVSYEEALKEAKKMSQAQTYFPLSGPRAKKNVIAFEQKFRERYEMYLERKSGG
jgi:hypothetical protein